MNDEMIPTTENTESAAPAPQEKVKKHKTVASNPVNVTKKVFVYFFLVLFALWILVPFYIVLVTSVKTSAEVLRPNFT